MISEDEGEYENVVTYIDDLPYMVDIEVAQDDMGNAVEIEHITSEGQVANSVSTFKTRQIYSG